MREILFRGKKIDNDEWTYGFYFEHSIDGQKDSYIKYQTFDEGFVTNEVVADTVGQYTGLTDKNGKKIFEGDILLKGFEKVLVKWNANQCRWGIYLNNYEICGFNESTQGYFEVIGNIYDNSELLEVEE